MGPAGSYSLAAHRLNPGLIAVADENEGLEAQTGPDYQSQVGHGNLEESGSFLEGEHTVPVVNLASVLTVPSFQDMQSNPQNSRSTSTPPDVLTINEIALVALEHVSMASWQPHLRRI